MNDLSPNNATAGMAVSYSKDVGRSKHELLDEISRLRKELRSKDQEIETLKGKIKLYKAL